MSTHNFPLKLQPSSPSDIIYTLTLREMKMSDKLASEKMILPEATSFSGSAARIWKLTDTSNTAVKWLLLVPLALCFILAAWCLVAVWYFVIFGLFGILVIPFRL